MRSLGPSCVVVWEAEESRERAIEVRKPMCLERAFGEVCGCWLFRAICSPFPPPNLPYATLVQHPSVSLPSEGVKRAANHMQQVTLQVHAMSEGREECGGREAGGPKGGKGVNRSYFWGEGGHGGLGRRRQAEVTA